MTKLYVRIKGREHGPFGLDKLKVMASRGQLSRIHQVSEDQQQWVKASEFPDIFISPTSTAHRAAAQTATTQQAAPQHSQPAEAVQGAAPVVSDPQVWHIEEADKPIGPFSFSDMQQMFRTNRFDEKTLVWKEGMGDWVPAETVDGLVSVTALLGKIALAGASNSGTADEVDQHTISTVGNSRGWVVLCAVVTVLWSIYFLVAGFVSIVRGAKLDSSSVVTAGIVILGMAAISGFFAYLLFAYSSSILQLKIHRTTSQLNNTLQRLNRIWVFFGTILIIGILLMVIGFILAVALDGPTSNSLDDFLF